MVIGRPRAGSLIAEFLLTAANVEYEFKKGKLNLNLEPGDAPLEISIELDAARLQGAL